MRKESDHGNRLSWNKAFIRFVIPLRFHTYEMYRENFKKLYEHPGRPIRTSITLHGRA